METVINFIILVLVALVCILRSMQADQKMSDSDRVRDWDSREQSEHSAQKVRTKACHRCCHITLSAFTTTVSNLGVSRAAMAVVGTTES